MSRVYKALEKAEKEKQKKTKDDSLFSILREDSIVEEVEPAGENLRVEMQTIGLPVPRDIAIPIAPANSFGAEQFRKLKTFIFRRSPHSPRCLLVTSSAPREGKTTLAVNLALSISQEMSKKVILIDADLRKPNMYPERYRKGLSDYLEDQIPLTEIMKNFEGENFMIIPAGEPSKRASELIGSKKMQDLIKNLRDFGEDTYILIDSPPVLAASEPLILSEGVDGVILVVMAGQVRRGDVRRAVDSVGRQKILGVVFNNKDLSPSSSYHYSRYSRGYHRKGNS